MNTIQTPFEAVRTGCASMGPDRPRGFTLMEVMIVVGIIGVLMAVALPSYRESVLQGRRAEGRAYAMQVATAQERFFTMANTYTTSLADLKLNAYSGSSASSSAYTIDVTAGPGGIGSSFVVTATPVENDPKCAALSLTETGQRLFNGTGTEKDCWGS